MKTRSGPFHPSVFKAVPFRVPRSVDEDFARRTGAVLLHPFNDWAVIALVVLRAAKLTFGPLTSV